MYMLCTAVASSHAHRPGKGVKSIFRGGRRRQLLPTTIIYIYIYVIIIWHTSATVAVRVDTILPIYSHTRPRPR